MRPFRYTRDEIAHHEAGHFVAAYVLRSWGYRHTLTIESDEDVLGSCKHELVEHDESAAADDVVICFAGLEAHARMTAIRRGDALLGAGGDLEHVDDYCERWPDLDRQALQQRSAKLVAEHSNMVELLAAALLEHKTLSGEVADTICGLIDDPVPFEVAVRGLAMHGLLVTTPADDGSGEISVTVPAWLAAHYDQGSGEAA